MMNRRDFVKTLILSGAGIVIAQKNVFGNGNFSSDPLQNSADAWKTEYPKILARIKPPKFKKKEYLITKFGAVGDGKTLNSEAFKKAIE